MGRRGVAGRACPAAGISSTCGGDRLRPARWRCSDARSSGYEALGVDPEAPEGEDYRRVEFEQLELVQDFDVVVAVTSLHHVADPAEVVDRITSSLASGGKLVVVEWAWEDFDEATASWCFERLGGDEEAGWLHHRRDEWAASRQRWAAYLRAWAQSERLHAAEALLRLFDQSFDRQELARGPYFFPDLAATSKEDEEAAIDTGLIRATRVDYVGRLR
jgi:SAM-dependent methyltransferase